MDDFETMTLLSKLPPREKMHAKHHENVRQDLSRTVVENYIREVVEVMDPFPEDSPVISKVMDALFDAHVGFPVQLKHVKHVRIPVTEIKKTPRFFARLLRTLNGSSFHMVSLDQMKQAAEREVVLRGTSQGWGSDAAFEHIDYLCTLLLASVGVDELLLPSYKSIPALTKSQIDQAFLSAKCFYKW